MVIKIVIKRATLNDLEEITIIEQGVQHNPWNKKQFYSEFKKDGFIGFIALQDKKTVGFIIAHKILDEVELNKIGVIKKSQKKGVGFLLLDSLIKSCIELKIKKITLEVLAKNSGATALYKKCGFEKIGLRKNYYGPNNDANILIKNLD